MTELLIGCGNSRRKKLSLGGDLSWSELVTIDHDPNCGADIAHDLNETPWPLESDRFDEAHAYCVLEHLGRQGDAASFFATFGEIWRVLKDGGHLYGICPSVQSRWAWGDPSHTRIIGPEALTFLDQEEYRRQVGKTAMTDFRHMWKGDFERVHLEDNGDTFIFVLKARKHG